MHVASNVRYGCFLRNIPLARRIGDHAHCSARVANAIFKRITTQSDYYTLILIFHHTCFYGKRMSFVVVSCQIEIDAMRTWRPAAGAEIRRYVEDVMSRVRELAPVHFPLSFNNLITDFRSLSSFPQ